MNILLNHKSRSGYIALIALMVIATAGLTAALQVSMSGIEEVKTSFMRTQVATARTAATACAEEGLERLRQSFTNYATTLSVNNTSCILTIGVSGTTATLLVTATSDRVTQSLHIEVDDQRNIITWEE